MVKKSTQTRRGHNLTARSLGVELPPVVSAWKLLQHLKDIGVPNADEATEDDWDILSRINATEIDLVRSAYTLQERGLKIQTKQRRRSDEEAAATSTRIARALGKKIPEFMATIGEIEKKTSRMTDEEKLLLSLLITKVKTDGDNKKSELISYREIGSILDLSHAEVQRRAKKLKSDNKHLLKIIPKRLKRGTPQETRSKSKPTS